MEHSKPAVAVDDGVDEAKLISANQMSPCKAAEKAKNEAPSTDGGRSAEVNQGDGESRVG